MSQGATDIYSVIGEAVNAGDLPTADRLIGLYNVDHQNAVNAKLGGAAEAGNLPLVRELIGQGANDFNNALVLASRGQQIETIKFLINQGANSFEAGLHLGMKNIEVVKLLLEYIPWTNEDLIKEAILRGDPEIFELVYIKFRGSHHFIIDTIATEGSLELLEKFLHLNPGYTYRLDWVIDTATSRGNLNIITYLLKYELQIKIKELSSLLQKRNNGEMAKILDNLFKN